MPYITLPYGTVPYGAKPYCIIPHCTVPYCTEPYHIIPFRTVPHQAVSCRTVPRRTAVPPYHETALTSVFFFQSNFGRAFHWLDFFTSGPRLKRVSRIMTGIKYFLFEAPCTCCALHCPLPLGGGPIIHPKITPINLCRKSPPRELWNGGGSGRNTFFLDIHYARWRPPPSSPPFSRSPLSIPPVPLFSWLTITCSVRNADWTQSRQLLFLIFSQRLNDFWGHAARHLTRSRYPG